MKPVLVVMAAGLGSRFGGLKQIEEISKQGDKIIDFSVYDAIRAGFEKVIFVINPKFENEFKNLISEKFNKYIKVEFSYQEIPKTLTKRKKPLGTGHAVLSVKNLINGPFCVINGDDFYGEDAFQKMFKYLSNENKRYCMIAYELEKTLTHNGTVARGLCNLSNELLQEVTEKTRLKKVNNSIFDESDIDIFYDDDLLVSMNFWGFQSDFLKHLELKYIDFSNENNLNESTIELFLPSVVDQMIKMESCEVEVLSTDSRWFGVTYKEDKTIVAEEIEKLKLQGKYPDNLWED